MKGITSSGTRLTQFYSLPGVCRCSHRGTRLHYWSILPQDVSKWRVEIRLPSSSSIKLEFIKCTQGRQFHQYLRCHKKVTLSSVYQASSYEHIISLVRLLPKLTYLSVIHTWYILRDVTGIWWKTQKSDILNMLKGKILGMKNSEICGSAIKSHPWACIAGQFHNTLLDISWIPGSVRILISAYFQAMGLNVQDMWNFQDNFLNCRTYLVLKINFWISRTRTNPVYEEQGYN